VRQKKYKTASLILQAICLEEKLVAAQMNAGQHNLVRDATNARGKRRLSVRAQSRQFYGATQARVDEID
jgi:hypothetical protein